MNHKPSFRIMNVALIVLLMPLLLGLSNARQKLDDTKKERMERREERDARRNATYSHSFFHDGVERFYQVYKPSTYDPSQKTPLVIQFHGGGGSPKSARRQSRMNRKAEEEGFLVVYPVSLRSPQGAFRWNNGIRTVEPQKMSHADDIGYVHAMLNKLEAEFNIDPKRIYATGISNGGMMTYRLACEMSDRIAAFAPVASALMVPNCVPTRPVPILDFHGADDLLVMLEGGQSSEFLHDGMRIKDDLMSAEESVGVFVKANQCPSNAEVTYAKGQTECRTYGPCRDGVEVTLCISGDGGHTWPGGRYASKSKIYQRNVGRITRDISATDKMWEFFKKHAKK